MAIPGTQYFRYKAQGLGLSDGAECSSWTDTSGNTRHAPAASGKRAIYKPGIINGKAVLRFDGADDYFTTPTLDLSAVNQLTVYMVVGNAMDNPAAGLAIMLGVTSPDDTLFITRQTDDKIMFGVNAGGTYYFKSYSQTLNSEFKLLKFSFDRTVSTSSQLSLAVNGSAAAPEATSGTATISTFANQPFFIGGLPTGNYSKLDIAEIVAFTRLIAGAEDTAALDYFNSEYFPGSTSSHTVVAADLSENVNGSVYSNAFARLTLETTATNIDFGVETSIYDEDPNIAQLGIRSNNSHFGFAACPSEGVHTISKTFPAGSKTIELTNGSQVRMNEAGAVLGTWLKSISANAPFTIVQPTYTGKIIYGLGDSILVGANATNSVQNGWFPQLRNSRPNDKLIADGWGFRSLKNTDTAAVIARMVAVGANILITPLSANDYFGERQTAAAYQAQLAAFLDAAKAAIPGLKVILLTMYPCVPSGANGLGSSAEDFRQAMRNVRSTRTAWVYIREGTTVLTIDDIETGGTRIHPITAGHTKIANDLNPFLNTLPTGNVKKIRRFWLPPATGDAPDGYRVRRIKNGGAPSIINVGNVLQYIDTAVEEGDTVSYAIQAYKGIVSGSFGETKSIEFTNGSEGGGVDPPPSTNFALASNGSTITADSTLAESGYSASASNAINGSRLFPGTNWGANPGGIYHSNGGSLPTGMLLEFNASRTINNFKMATVRDSQTDKAAINDGNSETVSTHGVRGYTVQYWNGTTWVNLFAPVTDDNKLLKNHSFSPVTTTKLQILITAVFGGGGYVRIAEIEAWG